jgi:hypothetical protein
MLLLNNLEINEFVFTPISYNVLVFTTPYHPKGAKRLAAMRLGGEGVSG